MHVELTCICQRFFVVITDQQALTPNIWKISSHITIMAEKVLHTLHKVSKYSRRLYAEEIISLSSISYILA